MCQPFSEHHFLYDRTYDTGIIRGLISRCTECGTERFSGIRQGKKLVTLQRKANGKWREIDVFKEFLQTERAK